MEMLNEKIDSEALESYLHRQIPLSKYMQVSVRSASPDLVILDAPLEPNVNHQHTLFGGSASAIATLAAWSLLHIRLSCEGFTSHLVIQSGLLDYLAPVEGRFEVRASFTDTANWQRFVQTLSRHKRARINVSSVLIHRSIEAGHFSGKFVALAAERPIGDDRHLAPERREP
jgi:thioesterase domain-containing protein